MEYSYYFSETDKIIVTWKTIKGEVKSFKIQYMVKIREE